jgi:Fic family protein
VQTLLKRLSDKKAKLDSFRPLPRELVKNLDDWFRVELTYTSNAIEGNTLTRNETALVIEKRLTIGGKTINEHLEAEGHAAAYDFIKYLIDTPRSDLALKDILEIHRIILERIDPPNAGRLRNIAVRIAGSTTVLPNPAKVPSLVDQFILWLHTANDPPDHPAKIAADAHLKFVTIHPFIDGNGRTARLLINLLLMQSGYPPCLIQKEERLEYINAIERAENFNELDDYYRVIFGGIERSLDVYLDALGT